LVCGIFISGASFFPFLRFGVETAFNVAINNLFKTLATLVQDLPQDCHSQYERRKKPERQQQEPIQLSDRVDIP
jgi:hypothetical protein